MTQELDRHSQADDTNWAVTEFANAELGKLRRTTRQVEFAHLLAQHPTTPLPEACGDDARLKAAYRFFANDASEPQDLLLSHIEATYGRLATVPVVLAARDTTEVDWTAHPATKGLNPLGHPAYQGLLVHSTLAFTSERVPLGLVAQQVWPCAPDDVGKRAWRKQLPISQMESQQWLTSLEAVVSAPAECPQTRFVRMGNREAEVYDPLAAPCRLNGTAVGNLPLAVNIDLNDSDWPCERWRQETEDGPYDSLNDARFADDLMEPARAAA